MAVLVTGYWECGVTLDCRKLAGLAGTDMGCGVPGWDSGCGVPGLLPGVCGVARGVAGAARYGSFTSTAGNCWGEGVGYCGEV